MAPVNLIKILSVNSEDPIHNAQNLLLKDNPNKKWKCKTPGEKQAIVILQLEKATKITGIDIGNEHSAFVEVLVAKSSNEDDYKVLLVASTLMSFDESKNGVNTNTVKFFNVSHLSKPAIDESWDRIKIICTQPFNKHVQYGLSFIIIHSKSAEISEDDQLPSLGKFTWKKADDDDNFSAGSLFTKKKLCGEPLIDDEAASKESNGKKPTKLSLLYDDSPETSKAKLNLKDSNDSKMQNDSHRSSKTKDLNLNSRRSVKGRLIYEDDDEEEPSRSKHRKKKMDDKKTENDSSSCDHSNNSAPKEDAKENTAQNKRSLDEELSKQSSSKTRNEKLSNDDYSSVPSSSSTSSNKCKVERKIKEFNKLLDDVVFVISGFQNPYRADLRSKALEMGAKYKPDWNSSCTHLICAFPNTPKFQQVQGQGKIVKKEWIEQCHAKSRRFPWRRFALDKKDKKKPESEDEIFTDLNNLPESDCDTDEEVKRIQRTKKKKVVDPFDEDTDIDEPEEAEKRRQNYRDTLVTVKLPLPYLPDFFSGKTFYISSTIRDTTTKEYLQRCIIAYKGKIMLDLSLKIDYVIVNSDYQSASPSINLIKETHPDVIVVKQDWIRECSAGGHLVSSDTYVCD